MINSRKGQEARMSLKKRVLGQNGGGWGGIFQGGKREVLFKLMQQVVFKDCFKTFTYDLFVSI